MKIYKISSILIIFCLFGCSSTQPTPAPTSTAIPTLAFRILPTLTAVPTSTPSQITITSKHNQTILKGFKPSFIWLFWSQDGQKLLIGTQETGILVFDVAKKKVIANFEREVVIEQLELSRDRKTFAVLVYPTEAIRLINAETGDLIRTIDITYSRQGRGLTFGADSKLLAFLNKDEEIVILDVTTGEEIRKLPKEESGDILMGTLSFSPDGKSLVTSFIDGTYKVWDTSTWKLQRVFECEDITFYFNLDGSQFATIGGGSQEPAVWDFKSGKKLFDLRSTKPVHITAIDFDLSGKYIAASGAYANSITIYDANTGKPLYELAMGANPVVFSLDGTKLASVDQGENASEVIIWDVNQP
jgi:WD40 repeat protein